MNEAQEALEALIASDKVMQEAAAELAAEGMRFATEYEAGWYYRVSQLDNPQWVTDL